MSASELDKSASSIRRMFEGVAPRYDLLNHLLSGSLDRQWRRRAVQEVQPAGNDDATEVLDLCCGTGDQAMSLRGEGRNVTAADFCVPMLALARTKSARQNGSHPSLLAADALALPFLEDRFHAVTMSFGARNLADLDQGLRQVAGVLRSGGKVIILEFARPRTPGFRQLYLFYLRRILPLIGKLVSPRGAAYSYLRDSVLEFPQRDDFTARLEAAGFEEAKWSDLSLGTVCVYTGRKA